MHSELAPRFAFGRAIPQISVVDDATMLLAGPDALFLRGGRTEGAPPVDEDMVIAQGDRVSYCLTHGWSFEDAPPGIDPWQAERNTESYWKKWCGKITKVPSMLRDAVVRSLITLKACTFEPTHGIVAAPTTSLPETPGGIRNWTTASPGCATRCWRWARSCRRGWRRGHGFWQWVSRAIAGQPEQMQIMYGIRGELA